MQAPIHVFLDHGFGHVPAVRLQKAAQRLGQQLVHISGTATLIRVPVMRSTNPVWIAWNSVG